MTSKRRGVWIFFRILTGILLLGLTACATALKPLVGIVPGKGVETINSAVSLYVQNGEKSSGGRGYLIFRQPDSFHLVILSPFGLTMLEVFASEGKLTCIVPSKGVAFSGRINELPDRDGLKSWGLMQWVVDVPPFSPGPAQFREHTTRDGKKEKVYYDERGVIIRKVNDEGDEVRFFDYSVVNGVPLPEIIEIISPRGELVRITFSEPEVNQPVEDSTLKPSLDGLKVLPFSEFKGFGG